MRLLHCMIVLGFGLLASLSSALADELADLQVQRIETLQQAVGLIEAQYRAGAANVQELIESQARLLDAKLDAASTQKQRVEVLKQQLALSTTTEKVAAAQVQTGQAKRSDFLLAKAARLRVETLLLKEENRDAQASTLFEQEGAARRNAIEEDAFLDHFVARAPTNEELAELLNMQTYGGRFRLERACKRFRFVVEGFRDGKRVFSASSGDVADGQGRANMGPGVCSYRVQILDLDIVRPARTEKNLNQLTVQIMMENGGGSTAATNVNKDTFDLRSLKYSNPELANMNPHRRRPVVVKPGERVEIFRIELAQGWDIDTGDPSVPATKDYVAGYFVSE